MGPRDRPHLTPQRPPPPTAVTHLKSEEPEKGAFGTVPVSEAFCVKCDEELNFPGRSAEGSMDIEFGIVQASTLGGLIRMRVEQPSGDFVLFAD